jgi:hypothetical protein
MILARRSGDRGTAADAFLCRNQVECACNPSLQFNPTLNRRNARETGVR